MPQEPNDAGFHRLTRLADKMHDKEYRDGYVAAHTRQVLAKQMREFRGNKSQTEFAGLIDKKQTVISRLENPGYSGWTLGTLFEIAAKLNVAVFVRFVDFPTFLKYTGDQSDAALHPESYDREKVDEFARLEAWQESAQDRGVIFNIDLGKLWSDKAPSLNYLDTSQPDMLDYTIRAWSPKGFMARKAGALENLKMLMEPQQQSIGVLKLPSPIGGKPMPIGEQSATGS